MMNLKASWAGVEEMKYFFRFFLKSCFISGDPDEFSLLVTLMTMSVYYLDCQLVGTVP